MPPKKKEEVQAKPILGRFRTNLKVSPSAWHRDVMLLFHRTARTNTGRTHVGQGARPRAAPAAAA